MQLTCDDISSSRFSDQATRSLSARIPCPVVSRQKPTSFPDGYCFVFTSMYRDEVTKEKQGYVILIHNNGNGYNALHYMVDSFPERCSFESPRSDKSRCIFPLFCLSVCLSLSLCFCPSFSLTFLGCLTITIVRIWRLAICAVQRRKMTLKGIRVESR